MNQYPLIRGQTDLKARNPALAEEWERIMNKEMTAEDVQPGSMKKVWWMCRKGHSWMAAVYSRTAGAGCPYCAGNRRSMNRPQGTAALSARTCWTGTQS